MPTEETNKENNKIFLLYNSRNDVKIVIKDANVKLSKEAIHSVMIQKQNKHVFEWF